MPEGAERTLSVKDYATFLEWLQKEGFQAAVIGGCAVGLYADLLGQKSLSGDLDLLATPDTLSRCLLQLERKGIPIRKRPQPRNIPVAFFEWEGKEINILTSSLGFADPDYVIESARVFHLQDLEFQVADPIQLLRNKLKVRRDKDLPHIEVLQQFIEEEIVASFRVEDQPGKRIALASRYLETSSSRRLPESLVARLIPLARLPSDFKFLANTVPPERAETLFAAAPPELAPELRDLYQRSS
ncbi:MAG: hypothetical protein ACYCW6_32130 [Candidatus Xenobia bacterium]